MRPSHSSSPPSPVHLLPGRTHRRRQGRRPQPTDAIDARRGTSNDPKLQALLTVVKEQICDLGNVSDASWQAALDAGWADAQLAESTLIVALNVFTNFFNRTVKTEFDLQAAPAL